MFELLVLVVPSSDKKDLYLVFIDKNIFSKLVRGPLFLSTTFSHGHSWSFTVKHALYPTDKTFEKNGSDICIFAFFHRLTPLFYTKQTYNM